MSCTTKEYYKDEETNEVYKDNINLNLKLGGYLLCKRSETELRVSPSKDLQIFLDMNDISSSDSLLTTSHQELVNYQKISPLERYFAPQFTPTTVGLTSPGGIHLSEDHLITCPHTLGLWPEMDFDLGVSDSPEYIASGFDYGCSSSPIDPLFSDTIEHEYSSNSELSSEKSTEEQLEENFKPEPKQEIIAVNEELVGGPHQPHHQPPSTSKSSSTSESPMIKKRAPVKKKSNDTLIDRIISTFSDVIYDEDLVTCHHCSKVFMCPYDLCLHYQTNNLFNFLKYKCPVGDCPFKLIGFNKKVDVRRHAISNHIDKDSREILAQDHYEEKMIRELVYICECSKVFYRRDSLQRHIRLIHTPKKPAKQKCEI